MSDLAALVDDALELARPSGRTDLLDRLRRTRTRIDDPEIRIVIAGEIKQGKSRLINALVNAPVCAVDDDVATVVPTVVRYGETPGAVVHLLDSEGGTAHPITTAEIADYGSERGNPGNRRRVDRVEVRLPREILAGGLVLIDSPGVGGLSSLHAVATLGALATADAVLIVTDAGEALSESELRFVRQATRVCPTVACVVTKTDLHPAWREVTARDGAALDGIGRGIRVIPVSADLRARAVRTADTALNEESGFPALVAHLRADVLGRAEALRRRSVVHDVVGAIDHLRFAVRAELTALEQPQTTRSVVAGLESARRQGDELARSTASWQMTLTDGIGDLIADMEYDLRDRMRALQREAEESISASDPSPGWQDFIDWIEQRIASAVSDTFVWTDERARWLATEVARRFSESGAEVPALRVGETDGVLEPVELLPNVDDGRLTVLEKILMGMRGSYGGVLMVGLATGLLGMALINPISIAAGIIIGTKVYRDERAAQLKRRQNEAKALVRHLIDDVVFHVGKELRDRLRSVQRATRDHFTALADESRRTLAESSRAVDRAEGTSEPAARIEVLREQLAALDALRSRAVEAPRLHTVRAEAAA